jgi:D-xylose transport system substrate-binding protein
MKAERSVSGWTKYFLLVGLLSNALVACVPTGYVPSISYTPPPMRIGLLLPNPESRFTESDLPFFKERLVALCPTCLLDYENAGGSSQEQQRLAAEMIGRHPDVLVLDPVDDTAEAVISAEAREIPLLAYDKRPKEVPDFFVSINYRKAGELAARSVIEKLQMDRVPVKNGGILALHNSKYQEHALETTEGAMGVFSASNYPLIAQTATSGANAEYLWLLGQVQDHTGEVGAVYTASLEGADEAAAIFGNSNSRPAITSIDGTSGVVQAALRGETFLSVYLPLKAEAFAAAEAALDLADRKEPTQDPDSGMHIKLIQPEAITMDNIQTALIENGTYKSAEICTAIFISACKKAGIK